MKDTVQLIDADGVARTFRCDDITEQLIRGNFTIYGMNVRTILQLRTEYQKLAGPDPMTEQTVRETFSHYGPPR